MTLVPSHSLFEFQIHLQKKEDYCILLNIQQQVTKYFFFLIHHILYQEIQTILFLTFQNILNNYYDEQTPFDQFHNI
ncbi:uncharacterized protein METZ01_LOCUS39089 [marine metagenome]|uniref:Uncharacterized protein n=1 Tax=marine metagenome TaxID=408172 RepID=A0A381R3B2_9ZZZZ